jgi:hypothetical protein
MSAKSRRTGAGLSNAIAAFKQRRDNRLDESEEYVEEDDELDEPAEAENAMPEQDDEPDAPQDDKVQFVKDRRDRRDEAGDPESVEEALAMVAELDEDLGTLLDVIEELQAVADLDSSQACDEEEKNEDDMISGEPDGDEEGTTLVINMDSKRVDAIVRERLTLGRLGDRLRLDGLETMAPLAAKKAIIKKVNPNMRLDGKSKAYINAAFDVAVDQISSLKDTNYQRRQASSRMDGAAPSSKTSAASARDRMMKRMMNGGAE